MYAIKNMKPSVIIGLIILALVYLWLCWAMIISDASVAKKVFVIAVSGIVIFVPLYKKYWHTNDNNQLR